MEGAKHISEALKTNSALQMLKCAAPRSFPCCQEPLILGCARARSLRENGLGAKGAKHISEALKTNSALKELLCAAARPFLCCQ